MTDATMPPSSSSSNKHWTTTTTTTSNWPMPLVAKRFFLTFCQWLFALSTLCGFYLKMHHRQKLLLQPQPLHQQQQPFHHHTSQEQKQHDHHQLLHQLERPPFQQDHCKQASCWKVAYYIFLKRPVHLKAISPKLEKKANLVTTTTTATTDINNNNNSSTQLRLEDNKQPANLSQKSHERAAPEQELQIDYRELKSLKLIGYAPASCRKALRAFKLKHPVGQASHLSRHLNHHHLYHHDRHRDQLESVEDEVENVGEEKLDQFVIELKSVRVPANMKVTKSLFLPR